MKLFTSDQIKKIDGQTIVNEPISSIDLMERASTQLFNWISEKYNRTKRFFVFAGPGNNGGDGLALARLLHSGRYEVTVYYIDFAGKTSEDWKTNFNRITNDTDIRVKNITSADQFPLLSEGDLIIDAIFGTGLTRPADGLAGEIIRLINNCPARIISIDIPSGMFAEDNSENNYDCIIKADYTLSFQFPKLAFMFAENADRLGEWIILPIGLSTDAILNTESPFSFSTRADVAPLLKKRRKFDHKGSFGHGLLIAGSYGKIGAAVLGAKAALRSGVGLLTSYIPSCGTLIIQTSVPESMVLADKSEKLISGIEVEPDAFSAAGLGPGLGADPLTQSALNVFLSQYKKPMVIDADALNILSLNKSWLKLLPENTILTPHPGEFERLSGKTENSYQRLQKQIDFARASRCIVILKGAHTSIATPGGQVYFNSTGNPGMAKGGSGDTLTGILLALLSQGYLPEHAAILGVYVHGLAGDLAAGERGIESILASDIINCLGKAFAKLKD